MSDHSNPLPWLAWTVAVFLVVVTTRNPLYLTVAGLAAGVVYLSAERGGAIGAAWLLVLRIGLSIAALSVVFNVVTVHAGDRAFGRLPSWLPVFGGVLTWNAVAYGVSSALALVTLLVAAATFAAAVDRAAVLRLVPAPLSAAGMAAVVALSFFPQLLAALGDVREAQAARGFRVRGVRDLRALVVPVLHLGLERAFDLAEAMESRGFGGSTHSVRSARLLPVAVLGALVTIGLVVAGVPGLAALAGAGALALALLALGFHRRRSTFRQPSWDVERLGVLFASLAAATLTLSALLLRPEMLAWSPYPALGWPPFALLPGLAALLLVAPALAGVLRT